MPDWAQPAFKGMTQLNRVQSEVYETALFKHDNLLLCAPTGAGKTNVAVLTILQQIAQHRNVNDGSIDHSAYKILYLAHAEAVVVEVVGTLSNSFKDFGIKVGELSEDPLITCQQIKESQIIVTTPETWDNITRKIQYHRTYTQQLKLVIIDEIHFLNDNGGPVLESIITRTVMHTNNSIRLVGLSAAFPNYEDVAQFLHIDVKSGVFAFDNSYRHVPISQCCIGIKGKTELQMDRICYKKAVAVVGQHQVIIFAQSTVEVVKTARAIRDAARSNNTLGRFLKEDSASPEILDTDLLKSSDLKDLLPCGFAIHHAGMTRTDQQIVEDLFANGRAQVLVADKAFAWGVNLSAHTIIIKGTEIYNPEKGAMTELSPLDVMQMLGCAGRPQYDSYGEGIILTGHSQLQYYLSLMNQQLPIESQFISKLADQLNAEIVLGTVQNEKEACHWIGYTYLYVRMLRNPSLYGLAPDVLSRDIALEKERVGLINAAATLLARSNMVKYDSGSFQVTEWGRIASYYNVAHKTIYMYIINLKPTMGEQELCQLLLLSEELKDVTVREDEMMLLAKLFNCVQIPIEESHEKPSAKINALLRAYILQLKLEGILMTSDMVFIAQSAGRLLWALFETVLKCGYAQLAEKALNLCKMVTKRMWSVQTPLRQFNGIPDDILTELERKDLTWESYYNLSLEIGETIHKMIHLFPKLKLDAKVKPISRTALMVELTMTPDFRWKDAVHGHAELFWVIVVDDYINNIIHHRYFVLEKQYLDELQSLNFTVEMCDPLPPRYLIRVVSNRWIGSQTTLEVPLTNVILPEECPPPTELLNLPPLPVTALSNTSFEALYQDFKHFNPVQTQVFPVLYNSDDNVLVAAPAGSGKTICAEFAILRNCNIDPDFASNKKFGRYECIKRKLDPCRESQWMDRVMRVVYITPIEALAKERHRDWEKKFGGGLNLKVVELTGNEEKDVKLLKKGHIIVSTLEKWNALSRCPMNRYFIDTISLLIFDELHLIGGKGGPVLETIVLRMRTIARQLEKIRDKIRFVALSTSLANAKDLGEWIGATSDGLFNFPHDNSLEIHIHGVDVANFEARMQAMTKATYTSISQHAKNGKPSIVFVPTRKHVRLAAFDLITYSGADSGKKPFLLQSIEKLEPFINKINDEMLKLTLREGVGYLHDGLNALDHDIVTQLFENGGIQVCIITSSMVWGVKLSTHLVVVMGTQYYDGLENAQTSYPVTDLLQMAGHVRRVNDCGKCIIFCHTPHEEYYKTFLSGAFPVESALQHFLHDSLLSELRRVYFIEDVRDYLENTFMYKRITKNPSYYDCQGVNYTDMHVHLSQLVNNTVADLVAKNCVYIANGGLRKTALGRMATECCISYKSMASFSVTLTQETDMKDLLVILSDASEYDVLPVRVGIEEEEELVCLLNHQRFSYENSKVRDPHVIANVLLQAHLSRQSIGENLALAQRYVLCFACKLLQAIIEIASSKHWLGTTFLAISFNQMLIQAIWENESELLLQVPHLTKELVLKCHERNIFYFNDLFNMEDSVKCEMLSLSYSKLFDISQFSKHCFIPELLGEVLVRNSKTIEVSILCEIERDMELVHAPFYPIVQKKRWWVLFVNLDDPSHPFQLKSIQVGERCKMHFSIPKQNGSTTHIAIYFLCNGYRGFNQRRHLNLEVVRDGIIRMVGDFGKRRFYIYDHDQ